MMSESRKHVLWVAALVILAAVVVLLSWSGGGSWSDESSTDEDRQTVANTGRDTSSAAADEGKRESDDKSAQSSSDKTFEPPDRDDMPDDEFGDLVKRGQEIFRNTPKNAEQYSGNDLSCANCHMDEGRKADSAPMWAAWVKYPKYRSKNEKVNDFAERMQGCFTYSMNGEAPPRDSDTMQALQAYSFWLAKGTTTGKDMEGGGYPELDDPEKTPDYDRGKKVFADNCAVCHGESGQGGRTPQGEITFPPLWGDHSFNWGAGMHKVATAAGFIKHNMPLGKPELSEQQAWDVAQYIDSHERPQDPRFTGSVSETREQYHDTSQSMYGKRVNGSRLGEPDDSSDHDDDDDDEHSSSDSDEDDHD